MKRVLMVVGGVIWFALVFFITWRVTFPGQAIEDRLRVEVANATNGTYELSLSDLRPWWTGVAADNVVLIEVKGRGDRLRDEQRVWHDVLQRAGLRVEIWRVEPQSPATKTPSA